MPILTEPSDIRALLARTHRIAVLGIKTEAAAGQPAFYVPKACLELGYDIVPVPVYYPEATHILGRAVFRSLAEVSPPVDMVNVFRRPQDLGAHFDDIVLAHPKSVWLQTGISDDAFAAKLSALGIDVVQDQCLMVEARRYA
jgi:hypothetical protein